MSDPAFFICNSLAMYVFYLVQLCYKMCKINLAQRNAMKLLKLALICLLFAPYSTSYAQETSAVIIEDDQAAENPLAPIEETTEGKEQDVDDEQLVDKDASDDAVISPNDMFEQPFIDWLKEYAGSKAVIMSILNQNIAYKGITDERILELDRQWRQEKRQDVKPLITSKLSNGLSSYLTRIHARSNGLFAEIFVIDENGLNVGQSAVTHDYWQGDEDKWINTYLQGNNAIHIGEKTLNEDLQIETVQISMTVTDPKTFKAIGAMTFEINLTELQRRKQAGL